MSTHVYINFSFSKIRGEFFCLLSSLIDSILLNDSFIRAEKSQLKVKSLRENLKLKLIPLVFYSCDEDNYACSFFAWQSILKCINNMNKIDENFWPLLNVRKAFIPKLIALLRSHANQNSNSQNVEIVYPALAPLISKLSSVFSLENTDEKLNFYKDVFAKLNDAINKENTLVASRPKSASASNRTLILDAIFDCSGYVFAELGDQNEAQAFIDLIISNYVS